MPSASSPTADQRHPLAAIALANDSGTGLPPGVLTLYEETAAGNAERPAGDSTPSVKLLPELPGTSPAPRTGPDHRRGGSGRRHPDRLYPAIQSQRRSRAESHRADPRS